MKASFWLLILLLISNLCFSQSAQETLDWLNSKKSESLSFQSYNVPENTSNTLKFLEDHIALESADKKSWTKFKWSTINDFRISDATAGKNELWIISNVISEGRPLLIIMKFATAEFRDRFSNAIEHMAKLNGSEKLNRNNYSHSVDSALVILKARLIDVHEGNNKMRLELSKEKIKQYYLNLSSTTEIPWKDVKEIKSEEYADNKSYYHIKIIGKADNAGNIPQISFYIFNQVALNYVNALNFIALQNNATLIKDNLF